MWLDDMFKIGMRRLRTKRQQFACAGSRHRCVRLALEELEDRTVPSSFTAANVSELIADIQAANLAGGVNTITLVAGQSFDLTAPDNTTHGPTGIPVIAANNDLTIIGNGDVIQRIAAEASFRLFDVAQGASLTLQDLTLQGALAFGSGASAQGGAIYNEGTLTLARVTVQGNAAVGDDGSNGANGPTGSSRRGGDGVDGADGLGGGVYSAAGTVNLRNVTLSSNTAQGGNGGKGGKGSNAAIIRIGRDRDVRRIRAGDGGNGGDAGSALGAALFVAGGSVNLTAVTISANSVQAGVPGTGGSGGAGVSTLPAGRPGVAGVAGVAEGGGIYSATFHALTLDSTTQFVGNTGGDIFEPSTIMVTGFPSPTTAGIPGLCTVTVVDASGLAITQYTGTIHLASSDLQAALPDDFTFTPAGHGAHDFRATLVTVGTQSLTATDTAAPALTGSQNGIVVAPAPVSFRVSAPASSTAGQTFSVTVTALDSAGNTAEAYNGTVHFTTNDPQVSDFADYAFTDFDRGTHTFDVVLWSAGSRAIAIADTVLTGVTGTTDSIAITPAAVSSFLIDAPGRITTGVGFAVAVTAIDAYGNTIGDYTGAIHFTSTDGLADLPGDFVFASGDHGVHTFGATLRTEGFQNVYVTDVDTGNLSGYAGMQVNPVALDVVILTDTTAGERVGFTVFAVDADDHAVPDYTGTVHFTSGDAQAELPRDYTFTADDDGMHAFDAVLKTAGFQFITATDSLGFATGYAGLTVAAAVASRLGITTSPTIYAGVATPITVTALDLYGNTAPGYTGTVHCTSSDRHARLPANYTFAALDQGSHTFSVNLKTMGLQTVAVADTATPGMTANARVKAQAIPTRFTASSVAELILDINASNTAGGSHLITLAPRTYFDLMEPDNFTHGATGLPVIAAGNRLSIFGNGDAIGRDEDAADFRFFDVDVGGSLTLANVVLLGGSASGAPEESLGGAIYSKGALTLTGTTLTDNVAARGGAIYIAGGSLRSTRDTFTANSATYGGGIYVAAGAAGVTSDTLSSNTATAGGAIFLEKGNITSTSSTLSGNIAQGAFPGGNGAGGAVCISGGIFASQRDSLVGNMARGGNGRRGGDGENGSNGPGSPGEDGTGAGDGLGGALYIAGGKVTLIGDTLSGNSAEGGDGGNGGDGGLGARRGRDFAYPSGRGGAGGAGGTGLGGALVVVGGIVTLRGDTITLNSADGGSGGLGGDGDPTGTKGLAGSGSAGGIHVQSPLLVSSDSFTRSHVRMNSASKGQPKVLGA